MLCSDGIDAEGGGAAAAAAAATAALRPPCSFCGGACWPAGPGVESPKGAPRGPKGSSTASSFVACAPYCFLRGPRAAGERGAAEALALGAVVAAGCASDCGACACACQLCSALQARSLRGGAPHTRIVLWACLGHLGRRRPRGHICAHQISTTDGRGPMLRGFASNVPPHGELPSSPRSMVLSRVYMGNCCAASQLAVTYPSPAGVGRAFRSECLGAPLRALQGFH